MGKRSTHGVINARDNSARRKKINVAGGVCQQCKPWVPCARHAAPPPGQSRQPTRAAEKPTRHQLRAARVRARSTHPPTDQDKGVG